MSKTPAITIQSTEVATPNSPPSTPGEIREIDESKEEFFPWISRQHEKIILHKESFPWQGLIGLIGSCLTIVCSWALLFACKDTQQWQDKWPGISKVFTPAALLSAIISVNSIFLHMAFESGTSIAWWIHANNSQATVGRLHQTWVHSSGVVGALRAGRSFNYIALATLFVALIPINGVLLQGALSIRLVPVYLETAGITLPFSSNFPSNFSGYFDHQDDLNGMTTRFSGYVIQYFSGDNKAQIVIDTNVTNGDDQNPSYIYAFSNIPTDCDGECSFTSLGVGLQMQCSTSMVDMPYDFTVNSSDPLWPQLPVVKTGLPIYRVSFDWNVSRPNTIEFDLLSKTNYACTGAYKHINCNLTAMTTQYETLIQNGQTIAINQSATLLSMPQTAGYDNASFVSPIPANNESATLTTKFGQLAKVFNDVFGSDITLEYSNKTGQPHYHLLQSGMYANAPWVVFGANASGNYDDSLNVVSKGAEGCLTWIDDKTDPLEDDRDMIMNAIYRFMFYLSYRDGNDQVALTGQAAPTFEPATDMIYQDWYHVVWWHWGASVATTLLIVLCVMPTFWGFWDLARRPTMSPVETARAFNAPVFVDQSPQLETEKILAHIHRRSIFPQPNLATSNPGGLGL